LLPFAIGMIEARGGRVIIRTGLLSEMKNWERE
jgi:hypothetical protein